MDQLLRTGPGPGSIQKKPVPSVPRDHALGPASATVRSGRPLATWVDDLGSGPPAAPTLVVTHKVSPRGASSAWTCQICSERSIPASLSSCPTCKRSRGTELRRSYMTAAEMTESVVNAVNGAELQAGGSAAPSFKAQRRGTSPSRARGEAATLPGRTVTTKERGLAPALGGNGGSGARVTFMDGLGVRSVRTPDVKREKHKEDSFGFPGRPRGHAADRQEEEHETPLRPLRPLISNLPEAPRNTGGRHSGLADVHEPPPPYMPPEPLPASPLEHPPKGFRSGGRDRGMAGPPLPNPASSDAWPTSDWVSGRQAGSAPTGAAASAASAASSAPAFFGGSLTQPRKEGRAERKSVQPVAHAQPPSSAEVRHVRETVPKESPARPARLGRSMEEPPRPLPMAESASAPSLHATAKQTQEAPACISISMQISPITIPSPITWRSSASTEIFHQVRARKPEVADVNMDIEAVLEAQKRRIEGLKNKLNMTIA
ncbi:unnamed protein product [Symbiodinium natans]|uniref:Uncharacterized protein n=1 Tax=Symbiodinium natans TaxID=878477 RepID=A0A812GGN4_9DINO|nr:unnamed protein product [Symbiodinium natans]